MDKIDLHKNKERRIEKTEKENNKSLNRQMVQILELTKKLHEQMKLNNLLEA